MWGGLHGLVKGWTSFMSLFFSFFLMHNIYKIALDRKIKNPWIYPLIQHAICNMIIIGALISLNNY
ncbi:MAG: hypothetical protein M0R46_18010 [Candidatus Muirbacterium halophilum]|nr:hypothetical protein [Candidatus Muirbacterium halophilum]